MMSNYIHNGHNGEQEHATLRMSMEKPIFHSTYIDKTHYFVVAIFEERIGSKWEGERAYCGFIVDVHNKETLTDGLYKIMQSGAKPYNLAKWLVEKDCVI